VLSAPKTLNELSENLAVLDSPKMAKRERVRWEKFGDQVRGEGQDQFETLWP
jgi:hypothetical protein